MSNFATMGGGKEFKTVDAGTYDALLFGVVFTGVQKQKPFKGEEKKPQPQVKFLFEIPGLLRDDGQTQTMAKTVNAMTSERSNCVKIINAISNRTLNAGELQALVSSSEPLKTLVGAAVVINVDKFTTDDGKEISYIKDFLPLDARIPKPDATRPELFFTPLVPDLKVFSELTRYTKAEIMEAENNKDFPTELHQAYVADQEQESANVPQVPASTAPVSSQGDLGAIQ